MATTPQEQTAIEEEIRTTEPAKVILFNDDVHSFEEVIAQIRKAIGCATSRAEAIALEAHRRGRAIVYAGDLHRCIEVSGILEEIELRTQIEV